jgi:hypothetical protein
MLTPIASADSADCHKHGKAGRSHQRPFNNVDKPCCKRVNGKRGDEDAAWQRDLSCIAAAYDGIVVVVLHGGRGRGHICIIIRRDTTVLIYIINIGVAAGSENLLR